MNTQRNLSWRDQLVPEVFGTMRGLPNYTLASNPKFHFNSAMAAERTAAVRPQARCFTAGDETAGTSVTIPESAETSRPNHTHQRGYVDRKHGAQLISTQLISYGEVTSRAAGGDAASQRVPTIYRHYYSLM